MKSNQLSNKPGQPKQDHKATQEAIRKLQETNAFSDIKDPVAWQREIRKDRP